LSCRRIARDFRGAAGGDADFEHAVGGRRHDAEDEKESSQFHDQRQAEDEGNGANHGFCSGGLSGRPGGASAGEGGVRGVSR
jgi:hypothetical protein